MNFFLNVEALPGKKVDDPPRMSFPLVGTILFRSSEVDPGLMALIEKAVAEKASRAPEPPTKD